MIESVKVVAQSPQRCEIGFPVTVEVEKDERGDLTVELCLRSSNCKLVPGPNCRKRKRTSAGKSTKTKWTVKVRCDGVGTHDVEFEAIATDHNDGDTGTDSARVRVQC